MSSSGATRFEFQVSSFGKSQTFALLFFRNDDAEDGLCRNLKLET